MALTAITIQACCLALIPVILFMTRDKQTLDSLMALGPLLAAFVLMPVVIVLSLIAVASPEIKKSLRDQIIIWAALLLNAGFAIQNFVRF